MCPPCPWWSSAWHPKGPSMARVGSIPSSELSADLAAIYDRFAASHGPFANQAIEPGHTDADEEPADRQKKPATFECQRHGAGGEREIQHPQDHHLPPPDPIRHPAPEQRAEMRGNPWRGRCWPVLVRRGGICNLGRGFNAPGITRSAPRTAKPGSSLRRYRRRPVPSRRFQSGAWPRGTARRPR